MLDGLLGHRRADPAWASWPSACSTAVPDDAVVVAVDLPSGVDPDTGETPSDARLGRRHRDLRAGQAGPAPAARGPGGRPAAGRRHRPRAAPARPGAGRRAAGSPPTSLRPGPCPGPRDDKYSRGVLGVVAGGSTYTGAAVLCSGAAVAAGAGMVRYVGPQPPTDLVRARWPEVVPGEGRVQAWVVGPGVDPRRRRAASATAIERALAEAVPCLVDAGALALLPEPRRARPCSPRTPASWPGCSSERGGATSSAPRSRPRPCATPGWRPS